MNKLFITGGTGFWGKNILDNIISSPNNFFDEVVVLTRDSKTFLSLYPHFNSNRIQYIDGDVRNFTIDRTDFNYILHLATDASKELNDNNPLQMMDVIINGTKNVIEIAKKQINFKRMIFASSGAVYGTIPTEIEQVSEEMRFDIDFTNPIYAYAQAKRTAEMMCRIGVEKFEIPIVILRGFAFIGRYLPLDSHFAIGNFLKQANEEGKITIKSDGKAKRSYMDAEELAQTILKLLTKETLKYSIYNIGSDEAKTLKEWAEWVAEKQNKTVAIEILGQEQKGYSAGNNYIPNIDRFIEELNINK